jgi:hypothetical protein
MKKISIFFLELAISLMIVASTIPAHVESLTIKAERDINLKVIPVHEIESSLAYGMRVPDKRGIVGLNEYNKSPLYVAHSYLSGADFFYLAPDTDVVLHYSDDTDEFFTVIDRFFVPVTTYAKDVYTEEGCIYFQTCFDDENVIAFLACKIE